MRRFAGDDPVVTGVGAVLTMHLGPEEVLLNLEVEFAPGTPAEEIHAAIHRIEEHITADHPEVNRIFIEVESLRAVSADGERVVEEGEAAGPAAPPAASPPHRLRRPASTSATPRRRGRRGPTSC